MVCFARPGSGWQDRDYHPGRHIRQTKSSIMLTPGGLAPAGRVAAIALVVVVLTLPATAGCDSCISAASG